MKVELGRRKAIEGKTPLQQEEKPIDDGTSCKHRYSVVPDECTGIERDVCDICGREKGHV